MDNSKVSLISQYKSKSALLAIPLPSNCATRLERDTDIVRRRANANARKGQRMIYHARFYCNITHPSLSTHALFHAYERDRLSIKIK